MNKKSKAVIISCLIAIGIVSVAPLALLFKKPKEIILGAPNISIDENLIGDVAHKLVNDADFYVATTGDDQNPGSLEHPFKTIERAKEAVKQLDKTGKEKVIIAIKEGNYNVSNLTLNSIDGGSDSCQVQYTSYGDGEVVLNSGIDFKITDFSPLTNSEAKSRINEDLHEKLLELDLNSFGLSVEDYGKLYSRGFYCTAPFYDGDYIGSMCGELFDKSGKRLTLARYPNGNNTITTNQIVQSGKSLYVPDSRNPKGDIYKFPHELIERISNYNFEEAWIGGFKKYSWADESSPIESLDLTNNTITTKFFGFYGADVHGEIFFYNVLEELDEPGEYFIDRKNNKLYFYPEANTTDVTLSLNCGYTLNLNNVNNVKLSNLTLKGDRNIELIVTGNNNTLENLTISACGGSGLKVTGNNNTVNKCLIKYMGQGGVEISGGDVTTLTKSNNVLSNSLIHHIGEIYQTVYCGISVNGVGNNILHNEIHNTSHTGIGFTGNYNIIKFNYLHQVCTNSDDSGAIYAGRRWDYYGNVISNNCIYGIRNQRFSACGIYLDDGLSGQTVENNYLIDVGFFSLCFGGGRDIKSNNNIIINLTGESINYDDRCRATILGDENYVWFEHSLEGSDLWENLYKSNYKSAQWQEAFEIYSRFTADFDDLDNPYFFPNPANSELKNNMIFNEEKEIGPIASSVYRFSKIENNFVEKINNLDNYFKNVSGGIYEFKKDKFTEEFGSIKSIGIII